MNERKGSALSNPVNLRQPIFPTCSTAGPEAVVLVYTQGLLGNVYVFMLRSGWWVCECTHPVHCIDLGCA